MGKQTKVCKRCGKELPIQNFSILKNFIRATICRKCEYDREKERTKKNDRFWFDDWIYRD